MKTKIILSLSALLISSSSINAKIGIKIPKRALTYVAIDAIRAQNSLREQRRLVENSIRHDKFMNHIHLTMLSTTEDIPFSPLTMISTTDVFPISPLADDNDKKNTEGKQRDCVRKEKKEPIIKDTDKDPPTKDKEKEVEKKKQDSSK